MAAIDVLRTSGAAEDDVLNAIADFMETRSA